MVVLYGEFVVLLRLWGQRVHQQAQPLKKHGLVRNRKNWLDLFKGISVGLLSLLCLFLFEGWLGWLSWRSPTQFLPKVILEGLIVALGLGLAEELLFRGWLLDELRWDYSPSVSLWLSSTLYALLHFVKPFAEILRTLPSFPGLMLLGLTLGWARLVHKGRLGFPIGLHAGLVWGYYIINVADLVRYSGQVSVWVTGIDRNPLAGGIGLLLLGVIALWLKGRF
jgi:membrane protease YdiL (CAAX protease family)